MNSIGRVIRKVGDALWLDREHDIHKGDVLAASYVNGHGPPLRTGRAVVSAVYRDGYFAITAEDAIPALVADPDFGDWLYRVKAAAEV